MVELRKRKEAPAPAASSKDAATTKKRTKSKSATPATTTKPANTGKKPGASSTGAATKSGGALDTGSELPLDELKAITIQTNGAEDTALPALLENNLGKSVAIFTYPKASTPGCTNQACLFRDMYEELSPSFEVYGLSNDSPKSNTNFKEKQKLPYTLLCDPKRELISKLGFAKAGGGTTRGVVVIDKEGKVQAWTTGGPQATLDAVKALMSSD